MLKGSKVVLTEIRPADKRALFRWINEPETVRFNAPYRPVEWDRHLEWFKSLENKDGSRIVFALRTRRSPSIIGVIQLIDIHPLHRSAELIIRIGDARNRGRGYGTEAVKLLLDFAWNDQNLNRVWLRVFASNVRAIKVYEKAGMKREGVMRRSAFVAGEWHDEVVLAALRPR